MGERQRVGIARALANDPLIVLAYEPTGNVDSKTATEIVTLFKEINVKHDKTIILVTHNIGVAREAERILRLRDGKVLSM